RLAQRLDGVLTLTDLGATRLAARMRLARAKVSVVPHGVLDIAAEPLPPLLPLRLVYFGFIYSGKGIEDLIDALAKVCEQQPEWREQVRLTIAGGTSPDIAFGAHGSYLDELRERVDERGLQAQIDWELDID